MTSIEIAFKRQMYTVEYETVEASGVCDACKQKKSDVEKLYISYIVRQQGFLDGKNIDIKSDLGKKIIECAKEEVVGEEDCSDCRIEMNC